MMWWPYSWGWGFGILGWIMPVIMIVFWGLVIWLVVVLVRRSSRHSYRMSERSDSALEILKRRYASGEINKQEFEEKKKDLI